MNSKDHIKLLALGSISQVALASSHALKLNAKINIKGVEAERLYNTLENAKEYMNGSLIVRERLNGRNGTVQRVSFTKNGAFECDVVSSVIVEVNSYGEIIKH